MSDNKPIKKQTLRIDAATQDSIKSLQRFLDEKTEHGAMIKAIRGYERVSKNYHGERLKNLSFQDQVLDLKSAIKRYQQAATGLNDIIKDFDEEE